MRVKTAILGVSHLLILFTIVLSAVLIASTDRRFYWRQYQRLDVAGTVGVSFPQLTEATEVLLDYTVGLRSDMEYVTEIYGKSVSYYNEREMLHMADVRRLYQQAVILSIVTGITGLIGLVTLRGRQELWYISLKQALVFLGSLLGFLGFYALIDFDGFWTRFHLLLFTNDLWLLNPARDRLILMVPLDFFTALFTRIFLISVAAISGYSLLVFKLGRKRYEDKRSFV